MNATRFRAAITVFAVIVATLISKNASASADGAGLFTLPVNRDETTQARSELALEGIKSRVARLRAMMPSFQEVQDFAVFPTTYGFTGFGVQVIGKM